MKKCYLNALGMICSAGATAADIIANLSSAKNCLTKNDDFGAPTPLELGLYSGDLPNIPLTEQKWQTRNNQFALAVAQQIDPQIQSAIKRYGKERIAVIIGTSTSGISDSEVAIKHWVDEEALPENYDYCQQEMGATADFIADYYAVSGPVYGVSTACSSGAKAIASARRLIQLGVCDAVIAGGVDTMCKLTVQGFSSLEAVSKGRCNPFSKNRDGINIGEGAALFLVSAQAQGVEISGVGESSDAHHISAPEPNGKGAISCMKGALQDAKLTSSQVDYVNLHGTATSLNDQMESLAMAEVFGSATLCSSTKPTTGHTLGAAGAVEAGIAWLMLTSPIESTWYPKHHWDGDADPALPKLNFVDGEHQDQVNKANVPHYILSNSFAFGGNNISLLLGRI